jgi:2-polyprenyl-6-methoxyphenol hydroxylase-like FAD-dependent oxidoreductase
VRRFPHRDALGRKGYKVLLLDKASFPSDTVSTHFIHAPGVAALERWGLRDAMVATGSPPVDRYRFDFGFLTIEGSPRLDGQVVEGYGPRRYLMDTLLVEGADQAGVEVRTGFTVEEILREDDGTVVGISGRDRSGTGATARARVVIGADGRRSLVAKAVRPKQYNDRPTYAIANYAYFSGLPETSFAVWARDRRGWGTIPTNDGLTILVVGWPEDEYKANRGDIEGNVMKSLEQAPEFAELARSAKRESRYWGVADMAGYFRKPFGDGWALVGDAGYHKHPITAMGMTDAFLDAERLTDALDAVWSGGESWEETLALYQKTRDEHAMPVYEMTCQFASMQPPPPQMQQVLAACAQDSALADSFASMNAGALPIPEFFGLFAGA